eukprot:COSAG06_NODE_3265_length_5594_cov_4.359054_5_plen_58_part_00
MAAGAAHHLPSTCLLLDKGANPDLGIYAKDPATGQGKGGQTALMLAVIDKKSLNGKT